MRKPGLEPTGSSVMLVLKPTTDSELARSGRSFQLRVAGLVKALEGEKGGQQFLLRPSEAMRVWGQF